MSLELPQWLGVYDYLKIIVDQKEDNDSLSTSLTTTNTTDPPVFSMKVTLFELHWTIMGQYIRIFFITLLFSCGPYPIWGLPVAYIFGIFLGIFVTFLVYLGRTRLKEKTERKRKYTYTIMLIMTSLAITLFSLGCDYIQKVWRDPGEDKDYWWVALVAAVLTSLISVGSTRDDVLFSLFLDP